MHIIFITAETRGKCLVSNLRFLLILKAYSIQYIRIKINFKLHLIECSTTVKLYKVVPANENYIVCFPLKIDPQKPVFRPESVAEFAVLCFPVGSGALLLQYIRMITIRAQGPCGFLADYTWNLIP